jgi:hypothetical protein
MGLRGDDSTTSLGLGESSPIDALLSKEQFVKNRRDFH